MLYPTYVAWQLDLNGVSQVDQLFGRERHRRITKAAALLDQAGYRLEIQPVTANYLDDFIPCYQKHMAAKKGTFFDVRSHLSRAWQRGWEYESISLWARETLLGGLLYRVGASSVSVAYRAFPRQLPVKLPIGCSFVAERLLIERALLRGRRVIWHGRDRNVYGLNSAIGVAMYKANLGCVPYVSRTEMNSWQAVAALAPASDALVLLGDGGQRVITDSILFTNKSLADTQQAYAALLNGAKLSVTVRSYGAP